MTRQQGLMVVLEGSDGSGKATQLKLLSERLKAAGYDVAMFDFPRYQHGSSHFIKEYLSGAYGPAASVSPYTASLFYALDRYEAAKQIREELSNGKIVLVDRYVGSNMAHQGAKFSDPVEQRGFFVWADNLEYQLLDTPRPNISLFLRVPAEVSAKLLKKRSTATGVARDQHEVDKEYMKKSVATYDLLCQLFPKDFTAIECTKNSQLLGIAQISDLIWKKLKPMLPPEPPHSGHAAVVTLGQAPATPSVGSRTVGGDKLIHKFKDSSLLLKLAVERQLSSIEPAGFTVWSDNGYRFYAPMGMPKGIEKSFKATMTRLGELHRQMQSHLESYYKRSLSSNDGHQPSNISNVLLPVTPMAALCDFQVVISPRAIERLAAHLLASDSQELQWTAKQIYLAARQIWPDEFKQPLESSNSPESISNIISKLAEERMSLNSDDKSIAKLLEASPRQEFDLLAESIYPYSSLSLAEISNEVANWSYQQKYQSLKSAVQDPTIASKIRYKFDIVSDQLTLSEAVNTVYLSSVQVQAPSPRFGYEVPELVEKAGIEDMYMECFDMSLSLFSALQEADRDDLTVYSTLLGHRLRWQFQTDAGNMKALLARHGSDGYHQLSDALRESVSEVHPLTWDVLSHANQPAPPVKIRQTRVKPARQRSKHRNSRKRT